MALMWRRAWGGPMDGQMIAFPPEHQCLPVSERRMGRDTIFYRVGHSLMDWDGRLLGHYVLDDDGMRATFDDIPRSLRSYYTQSDGDDGN